MVLGTATTAAAAWVMLPCYGAYAAHIDGVSRAWITSLVTAEQPGRDTPKFGIDKTGVFVDHEELDLCPIGAFTWTSTRRGASQDNRLL